jgi:NAD(P)-dependent dehydrogenase (short-subunit alcohol dehydrogenase family)
VADVDADGGEETARAIAAAGGESVFAPTDVSVSAAVEALVAHTLERFGQLDCAFNNAGINEEHGPLVDCPQELWDRILAVNLTGIFLCMKHEIPVMLRSGGGVIVNNASIVGLSGSRNHPAYVASKHGVVGLTRATARDYAARGIRVNAVCPGATHTNVRPDGRHRSRAWRRDRRQSADWTAGPARRRSRGGAGALLGGCGVRHRPCAGGGRWRASVAM